LPIENLEVKLDEIVASMIGNKKGFIAENKDVKEDDDFYQTKMQERYARALFKQINPNKDDDKPNLDEKEKKKVKRWLHIKQEDIDHVLEHFVPSALKEMPFEETTLTFDKLGGMDSEIKYLKRVVENTIAKDKEGTTIYIYGKPGLGVTSLARAIAGQYGYNLIVMYGADQESKWVAEAKDRLLDINDKAKASKPSIVVFDNIKYLTLNEGSADQSYKQAATSAIKSIIKPTKGVIYIATGETLDELDPSTRSLFKRCIEIKAPEKTEDYMKIWMNCLNPDYISEGTIKLEELAGASKGLTGGEINNICRCFSELGVNYTQKKLEQLLGLYKKNKDENMGARSAKAINDMDLATMILS
jgi:SpoVK/Ycf46/Vps4 family AAA+-type ATPase